MKEPPHRPGRNRPERRRCAVDPVYASSRPPKASGYRLPPGFRPLSALVLCFFFWTFGGGFDAAMAADRIVHGCGSKAVLLEAERAYAKRQRTAANTLAKVLESIDGLFSDPDDLDLDELARYRDDIMEPDRVIRKGFEETRAHLVEKNLPAVILKRHDDFVARYKERFGMFTTVVRAVEKAETKASREDALKAARAFLEAVKPPSTHQPFDPDRLPNRAAEPTRTKPRLKKEDFKDVRKADAGPILWDYALQDPDFVIAHPEVVAGFSGESPFEIASAGSLSRLFDSSPSSSLFPSEPEGWRSARSLGEGVLPSASSHPLGIHLRPFAVAKVDPDLVELPTDADLAENIEIQFTDAITAKAAELGNDPVKIYNWVRNNVEFVPTWGSIQGADYCLQTLKCNAFDTSSLLIALLRASDIPARYVIGTIELPIDIFMNWVGDFTNPKAAIDFAASGGIPVGGLISGGKLVKAQFEHIWVEAWIDYIPSRGARHRTGQGDTWIPLGASFKQYNYTGGIDLASVVPFDQQGFLDQVQATATINETEGYVTGIDSLYVGQTLEQYKTDVETYINTNYPDATVGDVIGTKEIVPEEYPYLMGTLPYRRVLTGARHSEIPDDLRHKVSFSVSVDDLYQSASAISYTASLPELAGKKITLSYAPATASDEAVVESYLPTPHEDGTPIQPSELPSSLPAYLINLVPELRVDGIVVASGGSVTMGAAERFAMRFDHPVRSTDVVSNIVEAGEYYGVGLDSGGISAAHLESIKARLENTKAKLEVSDLAGLGKDDLLGDLLHATAVSYLAALDATDGISASRMNINRQRLVSANLFSFDLSVSRLFGAPLSTGPNGLLMDADLIVQAVKARDNDPETKKQFVLSSGMTSSALERSVPEQLFSTPENPAEGISAVKALQIANDQGIPIYKVTQANIEMVRPRLSVDADVVSAIRNAVNAGKEVTVSESNITHVGWTGCGYLVIDPVTGEGAYMISGGASGAVLRLIAAVLLLPVSFVGTIDGEWAFTACLRQIEESMRIILDFLAEVGYWWVDNYAGFNWCIAIFPILALVLQPLGDAGAVVGTILGLAHAIANEIAKLDCVIWEP